MRRFAAVALALFLVLGMIPMANAAAAPSLVGSHASGKPGETVTITLDFSGNPGVSAWKITLNWNHAVLTLSKESIQLQKAFQAGMFVKNTQDKGSLQLVFPPTAL